MFRMFLDMVKPRTKRTSRGTSVSLRASKNAHLNAARLSIINEMQPVLAKCEREGLLLVNRYTPSQRWTPSQLLDEWRKGRYIWGPKCWRLEASNA